MSQDETDGFYYDQLKAGNDRVPLRIRSMVGLIPLCAVNVLKSKDIENLHGFKRRMEWFLTNRKGTTNLSMRKWILTRCGSDLGRHISWMQSGDSERPNYYLLAVPSEERK